MNHFLYCNRNPWTNYRPQRSWAKVIFLHMSVILLTEGVSGPGGVSGPRGVCLVPEGCLQFFGGVSNFFFFFFSIFKKILLGCTNPVHTPPKTVNARLVCILLECILVVSVNVAA